MKVAVVHDYFVNKGGAERVALALHRIWPSEPLFTAIHHPETTFEELASLDVRVSRLQRMSRSADDFRRLLPFFPRAMRSLAIDGYDATVVSSSGFAHHVRPSAGCVLVYCHTPPRFLYDERYDHGSVAPAWARPALPVVLAALRRADRRAARRAHVYVANSRNTAAKIERIYGRQAVVVHPPVEVDRYGIGPRTGDYYMMVGRLLPHRNMDIAVEAFTRMGRRLVVVGDGPIRAQLESSAGPTVEFRGALDDAALAKLYGMCRGVVLPEEADFGIVPLEANASGRPVVALKAGGAKETVRDGVTGVLFEGETADALRGAVERAESIRFDPEMLRAHAERYSEAAFAARMRELVESSVANCIECRRARRA